MDIINDIGPNVQLGLHLEIALKILPTALYYCHFKWGSRSRWFEIFAGERDQGRSCNH